MFGKVITDIDPCTLQGTVPKVTLITPARGVLFVIDVIEDRATSSIRCVDVVEDAEYELQLLEVVRGSGLTRRENAFEEAIPPFVIPFRDITTCIYKSLHNRCERATTSTQPKAIDIKKIYPFDAY
jgi:hypothetical protein